MNSEMFSFELPAWELVLRGLAKGSAFSGMRFLALLEGEAEATVEEAFAYLEENAIALNVQELPADFGSGDMEQRLRREHQLVQSGDILNNLEQQDPLRLYLEEVAGIPAAGDPVLLIDAYRMGDAAALQKITNLTISKAIKAAFQMTGRGVLLLDLIQEASLGLWQGILHYEHGDLFDHLQWWIDFYLAKVCLLQARESGVGRKMADALENYRTADHLLLTRLGRNPTMEELAQHLQITVEEAEIYDDMLRTARILEQAKKPPQQEEAEDQQAVEDTAYFQSRQRILDMLSTLSHQQAQVLTMRYGLEGALPMTAQETATKLNLTVAQVTELEAAALEQLRRNEN